MRIVLTGGGTGGHLFPAIALAEEFRSRNKNCKLLFIGSDKGIEKTVIPRYGYRLELLDIDAFKERALFNKFATGMKAGKALFHAMRLLRAFSPDVVIGTGGYSSGPVVLAARILKIKTAILEQNTIPGLTNRMLGRLVNLVFVTFEESKNFFPGGRVVLAGNPVRKVIIESWLKGNRLAVRGKEMKFTILIFGGSQGAKAINTAFIDAMEYLADIRDSINIIHQTGDADYEAVRESYERKGIKAKVLRFIDDMALVYSIADLVICRAGATSIAEITTLGLPSILIPYPFAANNHQEINARCLSDKEAAVMLKQDEIIGDRLAALIRRFYENPSELDRMRVMSLGFGRPDAAKEIADAVLRMVNGVKRYV